MSLTKIEEMMPFCVNLKDETLEVLNPAIYTLVERYRKIYAGDSLQDDYSHDTFLDRLKASDKFLLDNSTRLESPEFFAAVKQLVIALKQNLL